MNNICESCGHQHDGSYGSGRFCNEKCAKSFSTKAKRKEINKKVSKILKNREVVEHEDRECIICHSVFRCIKTSTQKVCRKIKCRNTSRSISQIGISRNVGKNNAMYGKAPHHTKRHKFFSNKNNKEFIVKSTYELSAIKILENDNDVLNYQYEPFNIPYDENHSTIPDFLVEYKNKKVLIEVKPQNCIKLWNNKIKIEAMKKYCRNNNLLFKLWTEKNIASEMLR